jgi:hypothetical protein
MTAAIRTLVLLALSCLVPAVWLAVEGEHEIVLTRAIGASPLSGLDDMFVFIGYLGGAVDGGSVWSA